MLRLLPGALLLSLLVSCSMGNVIGPGSSIIATTPVTGQNAWTVLVYMNADNDLPNSAFSDLLALQAADLSGKRIVVLALVDLGASGNLIQGGWPDARLYRIQYYGGGTGNTSIVSERLGSGLLGLTATGLDQDIDMGDPNVLANFLRSAKANYPAQHYALVLWGHGSGWRTVGTDSTSADPLYVQELGQAINGQSLDVIGFDTPSEAMLEVAWQIQTAGRYMVASEGVTPVTGWDLQNLLSTFASSGLQPLDFVASVVTAYSTAQAGTPGSCISAVDLTMLSPVMTALNSFSNALYSAITSSTIQTTVRQALFTNVESYSNAPGDKNLDLTDMAEVAETIGYAGVQAEALKSAVTGAVVAEWHNANGHPSSHGLAVHYIPVQQDGTAGTLDSSYFRGATVQYPLTFAANSAWAPVYPSGPGLEYRIWQEKIVP